MAKVPVAVRLEPEVLSSVDALAKVRACSRQVLLEAWVSSGLEDARGGVVDLPPVEVPAPVEPERSVGQPAPVRMKPGSRPMSEASMRIAREMGWMQ